MTQRPDLFQAAIAEPGIYDMIRYQQFTIGEQWAFDFGKAEHAREFDYLNAWSPLHNALPAEYPATMILAGTRKDDRMYILRMPTNLRRSCRRNQRGPAPILLCYSEPVRRRNPEKYKRDSANQLELYLFFHLKQPVVYELGKS
jgi:prolyl oligopeptidase